MSGNAHRGYRLIFISILPIEQILGLKIKLPVLVYPFQAILPKVLAVILIKINVIF